MNWSLFALFAVVLGTITASNVWLRRRAEAERRALGADDHTEHRRSGPAG